MTLGSDYSAVDDFDYNLTFLSGEQEKKAFVQAIARRLGTPRGALFYDRSFGLDMRTFLSENLSPRIIEGVIDAEVRKDPRVASSTVQATYSDGGRLQIDVVIRVKTGDTFPLTFTLSDETRTLVLARPSV